MGRLPIKKPKSFNHFFKKWLNFEITQQEAAEKLGVSQTTFSNWAREKMEKEGIAQRRPDNLETVVESYGNKDISLRIGGDRLNVSHTTFARWYNEAEEQPAPHPMSLSSKCSELSETYEKLNEDRNSSEKTRSNQNLDDR